jgi:hypothetical protein
MGVCSAEEVGDWDNDNVGEDGVEEPSILSKSACASSSVSFLSISVPSDEGGESGS